MTFQQVPTAAGPYLSKKLGPRIQHGLLPRRRPSHQLTTRPAASSDLENPSKEEIASFDRDLRSKILPFLIPVSAVVLAEPLLALCTSMYVGTFSTTVQLAALGPATIVISFFQYLFYSLQVATLALVAGALREADMEKAQRSLSCCLFVALTWGLGAGALMFFIPKVLIAATGVEDASVIAASAEFLRVRAVGQPFVLILMTAQSALLAQQNPIVPGVIVSTATALAVAGHELLVKHMGMGIIGAAYSTATANILAGLTILLALNMKGKLKPKLQVPSKEDIDEMVVTVAPVSVTYMSKNACYMLIQTTAASTLSVISLAAHSAVFSIWAFASYMISPIEQAALTYIPAAKYRWQMLQTGKLVMTVGPVTGLIGGMFVLFVTRVTPGLLSQDPLLWPIMAVTGLYTVLSLFFTGIDVSANGMTIALGDGAYVAKSLLLTLCCVFIFTTACRYYDWGIEGIWAGTAIFFLIRAMRSSFRIWQEYRIGAKEPESPPEPETSGGVQPAPA